MKRLLALGIAAAALALPAAPAWAISPPAVGQPNVDCQSSGPPGLFTTQFTTVAASVYANPGTTAENMSNNMAAESQYDVACFASAH